MNDQAINKSATADLVGSKFYDKNSIVLYIYTFLFLYKTRKAAVNSRFFSKVSRNLGIKVSVAAINKNSDLFDFLFDILTPYILFLGYTKILKLLDIYPFNKTTSGRKINSRDIVDNVELFLAFESRNREKLNQMVKDEPKLAYSLLKMELKYYNEHSDSGKKIPDEFYKRLQELYVKYNILCRSSKKECKKLGMMYHPDKLVGKANDQASNVNSSAINLINDIMTSVYYS